MFSERNLATLRAVLELLDGTPLAERIAARIDGGPGSGNFGHAGRPGQRGGSAPGSGSASGSMLGGGGGLGGRYTSAPDGAGAKQANEAGAKEPGVSPAIASRKLSSDHIRKMKEDYDAAKEVLAERAPEREAIARELKELEEKKPWDMKPQWELKDRLSAIRRKDKEAMSEHGVTVGTNVERSLLETGIEFNPPQKWDRPLPEDEIIKRISGGDRTEGSCSSLALAYMAQKKGYDVQDFRGGESTEFFGNRRNINGLIMDCQVKRGAQISYRIEDEGCAYNAKAVIDEMEEGKEYYFTSAQHAAIVRVQGGKPQYLELQSPRPEENGWTDFDDDIGVTLNRRFGAGVEEELFYSDATAFDIDILGGEDFGRIMSYLNTNTGQQQKGKDGSMR